MTDLQFDRALTVKRYVFEIPRKHDLLVIRSLYQSLLGILFRITIGIYPFIGSRTAATIDMIRHESMDICPDPMRMTKKEFKLGGIPNMWGRPDLDKR